MCIRDRAAFLVNVAVISTVWVPAPTAPRTFKLAVVPPYSFKYRSWVVATPSTETVTLPQSVFRNVPRYRSCWRGYEYRSVTLRMSRAFEGAVRFACPLLHHCDGTVPPSA